MVTAVHAMPAGRQAPRKRAPLPEVPEATLSDVRKALQAHRSFTVARMPDLLIALLLFTGLLTFLIIGFLSAAKEHAALVNLRRPSVRLDVEEMAQTPQIHAFLQALMGLPQVQSVQYVTREQQLEQVRAKHPEAVAAMGNETNPFSDSVGVTLRSPGDFNAFFAVLRRPQLTSILQPRFLWEVPDAQVQWQSDVRMHRSLRFLSLSASAACLLLLVFAAAQFLRCRLKERERHIRSLRLLGADAVSLYLPFASELGVLLLGSFGLSLLFVWFFHGTFLYL